MLLCFAVPTLYFQSRIVLLVEFMVTCSNVSPSLSLFIRYAHGPVPLQSQQYTTSQDIINSVNYIRHEMVNYKPNLTQVRSYSL